MNSTSTKLIWSEDQAGLRAAYAAGLRAALAIVDVTDEREYSITELLRTSASQHAAALRADIADAIVSAMSAARNGDAL